MKRTKENNYGLKIVETIYNKKAILVDAATGYRADFIPQPTTNGWTVVLIFGPRTTGRGRGRAQHEIDVPNGYTESHARALASLKERETFARLRSGVEA